MHSSNVSTPWGHLVLVSRSLQSQGARQEAAVISTMIERAEDHWRESWGEELARWREGGGGHISGTEKANSEACNAWFVRSTEIHSYPDVLSSGAMGRGDTQDLADDFQQDQSHPMLAGLLEFLHSPGACLSPGQWRASSFYLQTCPAPTHQRDTAA